MLPYNKKLSENARSLRRNMTPEERHLWYDFLKKLPCRVKRQYRIENYIVDFYVASKKVVIEIDGIQHQTEEHRKADIERDEALKKWGITVLRYTNRDINNNFHIVTTDILNKLDLTIDNVDI